MVGIVDFEISLPSSRITVRQMAAKSGLPEEEVRAVTGCDGIPVLGAGEREWELALRAARTVMERTQVPPSAVRTVIYAGSGEWDTPFWSPAAKVAHELGIERAFCFELANYCNSVTAAVQIACDKTASRPDEYALVLIGDRVSTMLDYGEPGAKELFNNGDAGGALLLSASGRVAGFLGAEMRTDPSWSDYYTGVREGERIAVRRHGSRDGLGDAYIENFAGLTTDLLASIGRDITDVAYMLVTHGDRRIHERLLRELGLPEAKSVFNYHRLGHMGNADTLIAMQDLITGKSLGRGDLVLHATSALGFSWGVMAMEYTG
ncbi:3-oxoacyl-ACP synthase III family protein [Streptomyces olivoreticuli]|uniref:3-oxoacyl-ACP synthase III family protein n=1 Tax=Streptomyces olivoreticuli TaxID=68246 RepID=UPI000E25F1E5|nr:3-oxoacyl-[acyl-carrier-protein] synthase III C-terminal domain-containing protein [Streptomyces olivoreticuli]